MFTLDKGVVDVTALVCAVLAYGIVVSFVSCVLISRKRAATHRKEVAQLATGYIINEAHAAIYLMFTKTRVFLEQGPNAWPSWRQNYLLSVATLCDERAWIDRTCVGQLPLMDNPAYAVDSSAAHEITLFLSHASLVGRPKLPA